MVQSCSARSAHFSAAGGESREREQGKRAGGGFGNLIHVEVDHRADVLSVFGNGDEGAAAVHVAACAMVQEGQLFQRAGSRHWRVRGRSEIRFAIARDDRMLALL